jgi:hypothetical protein
VSHDLAVKLGLGLDELAVVREPFAALLSLPAAFRRIFRGASIALMRWEKLLPLLGRVNETHDRVDSEIRAFVRFIEAH